MVADLPVPMKHGINDDNSGGCDRRCGSNPPELAQCAACLNAKIKTIAVSNRRATKPKFKFKAPRKKLLVAKVGGAHCIKA
jgi:hypothetical protein